MKKVLFTLSVITLIFLSCTFNFDSPKLVYSTYIGSSGYDGLWNWLANLELDEEGSVHFVSSTYHNDFPVTTDAYDSSYNSGSDVMGNEDLIIVDFNIEKNELEYASYFGGETGPEFVSSVLYHEKSLYFAGNTGSSDLPMTNNTYDSSFNGPVFRHSDGYLVRFDNNKLVYSTYIGSSGNDWMQDVFITKNEEIIAVGVIKEWDELPVTKCYLNEKDTSSGSLCVVRFNSSADSILSMTVIGPSWNIDAEQDAEGNIYIAGSTYCKQFPTTSGAYDTEYNGGELYFQGDIYVTKLNPTGEEILFSTFLGGSGEEGFPKICLDSKDNVLICAGTKSKDFPITQNAFDKSFEGERESFLAKLSNDGKQLLYSTYVGANEKEYEGVSNITASKNGNIYLAGTTDAENFYVTENAVQKTLKGGKDIYILGFDSDLNNLGFSTYLGGTSDDEAIITSDDSGNIIGVGMSQSSDFPVTPLCFDKELGGEADIIIFKITF